MFEDHTSVGPRAVCSDKGVCLQGAWIHGGSWLSACPSRGGQIYVLNEAGINQLCGQMSSTHRREALNPERAERLECRGQILGASHHERSNPWTRCKSRTHPARAGGEGQHHYLNVRNVKEKALTDVHSSNGRHTPHRIPWLPERCAQADQFWMPGREHNIAAPYRVSAREDGIGRHLRESFVDDVLVGLAASEREGIGQRPDCRPGAWRRAMAWRRTRRRRSAGTIRSRWTRACRPHGRGL